MIKWIKRKINTPYLFRQPEMVSSFHQLLLALAVLDIIYVTTNIVDYSVVKVITFFFSFFIHFFIAVLSSSMSPQKMWTFLLARLFLFTFLFSSLFLSLSGHHLHHHIYVVDYSVIPFSLFFLAVLDIIYIATSIVHYFVVN